MKKLIIIVIFILFIILTLLIVGFGFDGSISSIKPMSYSKDLNCGQFSLPREIEICKSAEKYQKYKFTGHSMIFFGYKIPLEAFPKIICDIKPKEADKDILDNITYGTLDPRIRSVAGILSTSLFNKKGGAEDRSIYSPDCSKIKN